ncbi:DUF7710 domain-containing protein [Paracidovorax cattleyae]|uniref:DUF7710 domain-containing protein n=1 Tax=Paracidovorax cattleyae TaxID=80868 RepID=UPI0018AFC927|nr:hypothetical protein [Paracidovorax cattleyae]MBF9263997.1 hypothetical protein [Paracidovorax cattleyae]
MKETIWIFNGENSNFPSAVFSRIELAEEWIAKYKLNGVLTSYPIDQSVYDWAIINGYFIPKNEKEISPQFIGKFSSASQEHIHYENGKK